MKKIKVAIIGASGYTGSELIRILSNHPQVEIAALTAHAHAGSRIDEVFSHLNNFGLPQLKKIEEVDFSGIDAAFCCLPHTTSQKVIKELLKKYPKLKIFDLSADFRLEDPKVYEKWYGHAHVAPELQPRAVYGLSEIHGSKIKNAQLIACPGCYPTSALLPLIPLIENKIIKTDDIIIDSKSGVSGAGRTVKQNNLFCEINDSIKAYGIANHRHTGEIEQELTKANSGHEIKIEFVPHLVPMNRGIISTIYVNLADNFSAQDAKKCLQEKYAKSKFVKVVDFAPATRDVFSTNFALIHATAGRSKNRLVLVSVIDNLGKGASSQAVQNFNLVFGLDEAAGIAMLPVFP